MSFLFIDHYYQGALDFFYRTNPELSKSPPCKQQSWLLEQCHGTSDYWERALRAEGHSAATIIAGYGMTAPDLRGRFAHLPDVICCQNINQYRAETFEGVSSVNFGRPLKVGFCSYAAPPEALEGWDVVFTSFPWLARENPSKVRFLPLAFGTKVLARASGGKRVNRVVFAGGMGHRHIWKHGSECIEAVINSPAGKHLDVRGYGPAFPGSLGECWGLNYFRELMEHQIVVNRHGEVARGFANNMRLFEATGCGACLLTEEAPNLKDYFLPGRECVTYRGPDDLVRVLKLLIENQNFSEDVALAGQAKCLAKHTYENRVGRFLEIIEEVRRGK